MARKMTLIAVCLLLMSCATVMPPQLSDDPSALLRKRIEIFMQADIDGKWDEVYDFFEESFRNSVQKSQFINKIRKIKTKSYIIENIDIAESKKTADVKLKLEISFQGHTFSNAPKIQHWIWEKGNWFLKSSSKAHAVPISSD